MKTTILMFALILFAVVGCEYEEPEITFDRFTKNVKYEVTGTSGLATIVYMGTDLDVEKEEREELPFTIEMSSFDYRTRFAWVTAWNLDDYSDIIVNVYIDNVLVQTDTCHDEALAVDPDTGNTLSGCQATAQYQISDGLY